MQDHYSTTRLELNKINLNDAEFILELLNTAEWIKFIGNRNVKTKEDAIAYIQRMIDNPDINYWVVNLQGLNIPIGVITFIQRDYLDHPDIGFAFLAEYTGKGYAYEAANEVLQDAIKNRIHTNIIAITVKENLHSILLLEKLGFHFDKEIEKDNELLMVYSVTRRNKAGKRTNITGLKQTNKK